MDALRSLVQPFVSGAGGSSVIDGVKLVTLAHFPEGDHPYNWLTLWLSRRPEWQRSREFEATTYISNTNLHDNSFGNDEDNDLLGRPMTRVVFQPSLDTTHTIYYRGHWLRVHRSKNTRTDDVDLSISVMARNNTILKNLVLEAKREYEAEVVHRVQIYLAASHSWKWTYSRHKRPMSSIVLNPGVKEMLLNDIRDFLKSEKWYADRGIPFRRGYLLHGVPGSGKSSVIHAIAGELELKIYIVSLSSSWISDSTLTTLMARLPARCIVLLEDLDAVFTRSVTRDNTSNGSPESSTHCSTDEVNNQQTPSVRSSDRHRRHKDLLSDVNTLSLSGLLNALDGVAAAEGRILFATTNHLERLDSALTRPGRMDVWIEFKNASKWQAEALFRNFFPSAESDETVDRELEGVEFSTSSRFSSARSSTLWSSSPSFSSSSTSLASSPRSVPTEYVASLDNREIKEQGCYGPPVKEHLLPCQHSTNSAKSLTATKLTQLVKEFVGAIPEEEFSVAALQGYLLKNKSQPEEAASGAAAWIRSEIELKHRLEKEKDARESLEPDKRRKESVAKESTMTEVENRELELKKLRQQLCEHERRTKSSGAIHAALGSATTPEPPSQGSTDDNASSEENDRENVLPESNLSITGH